MVLGREPVARLEDLQKELINWYKEKGTKVENNVKGVAEFEQVEKELEESVESQPNRAHWPEHPGYNRLRSLGLLSKLTCFQNPQQG